MPLLKQTFRAIALAAACVLAGGAAGEDADVLLAYVANAGNNHVQVVDLASGQTLRKIYSGVAPWRLLRSPDGRQLWVQHWASETTAVVDLERHQVVATLPVRGPGAFSADGERFLSFSWPSSALRTFDRRGFAELDLEVTEVDRVYGLASDPRGGGLYLAQHDPAAGGQGRRYTYVVRYPSAVEEVDGDRRRPPPRSLPTGRGPVQIVPLAGHPFVLTVDRETDGLTLLNRLGDGRAVPACPAPRQLALSADQSRMVVVCWDSEATRHSQIISYRTDFTHRPWPKIVREASQTLAAGLVAVVLTPDGERAVAIDQPGGRLLELDARSLRRLREHPTGDVPTAVALAAVPERERARLAEGQGDARRKLRSILSRMQATGGGFTNLSWTESISEHPLAADAEAGAPPPPAVRRLTAALEAPDRSRLQGHNGRIRLAAGGWAVTVDDDGGFWVAPRQELLSLLYALPGLELDDAIRRLAGDVAGSPYLRGGLAVDLVTEVREDGRRYHLLGALAAGEPVAQLWIDAASGHPAKLVEKFPVASTGGHSGSVARGLVETRFSNFARLDAGVAMPLRLERSIDGQRRQVVDLGDFAVDRDFPAGHFDLARLGAVTATHADGGMPFAAPDDLPGRPVTIMAGGYLAHPGAEHPPYATDPPTSGPRLRSLADWGVHPLPVPLELQVHNLEHGGVIVQYNCPRGCPRMAADLERLLARYDRVILAPYPRMKARIALTAWGRIELLEALDEARITAFVEAFEGLDHHDR